MEFITAPDKADYIELGDAVNISSNSMWRHKKRMLLFAAVYGFGLALSFLAERMTILGAGWVITVLRVVCVFGFLLLLFTFFSVLMLRRAAGRRADAGSAANIRLDEAGIASRAVDGTSHLFFAWSRLQRAVFSENLCAFIMKNGVVVFFRRQDAPPTWDARAFLATVRPDIVPQEVRTGIRRKI